MFGVQPAATSTDAASSALPQEGSAVISALVVSQAAVKLVPLVEPDPALVPLVAPEPALVPLVDPEVLPELVPKLLPEPAELPDPALDAGNSFLPDPELLPLEVLTEVPAGAVGALVVGEVPQAIISQAREIAKRWREVGIGASPQALRHSASPKFADQPHEGAAQS